MCLVEPAEVALHDNQHWFCCECVVRLSRRFVAEITCPLCRAYVPRWRLFDVLFRCADGGAPHMAVVEDEFQRVRTELRGLHPRLQAQVLWDRAVLPRTGAESLDRNHFQQYLQSYRESSEQIQPLGAPVDAARQHDHIFFRFCVQQLMFRIIHQYPQYAEWFPI